MATATTNGKRWASDYPELGTGPVPIEPCISPEYFELEREKIFRKVWLNVGRVEEIPQPGDFFVRELAVCKTSLLVVRGRDGQVRAFHNMCSHRGNKLEWDKRGRCQGGVFTCKFHGWSYNTEGRLVGVPDEENFFALDKAEHGLTPVATDTWEGFIFISLDPQPKETLPEYLGEIGEGLRGYPFDKLTTCFVYQAEEQVNWKVLLDAQQEGYHVPFLHKRSLPNTVTGDKCPFFRSLAIRLYKRHRMLSSWGNPDYKPTPIAALAYQFGAVISSALAGDSSATKDEMPPGVNPTRSPNWSMDFNIIFPNFVIAVLNGTYFTEHMWPLAVDRTIWEVRMYYPPAANAGQRFSQEYSKCVLRDAVLEDANTHERTQSVLASGAKTHFVLQDEEVTVRHGHRVVEDYVGFYRQRA
jgi:phenylpropionate dioxygenase-like ring-hydroxylating dioxygenase large terminal subunit